MMIALSALSFFLGGYFFGLSDGLKKDRRPEAETEVKFAIAALACGAALLGFSLLE